MSNPIEISEGKADEMLLKLNRLEKDRPLHPMELVWKGRYIQMGSGAVISDYREALPAFREALDIDDVFVPALLELGWFYYAVENNAKMALPFFDKALAVCLDQLREAIRGKQGCIEELQSSEAATNFLQEIVRSGLREEDFSEELAAE